MTSLKAVSMGVRGRYRAIVHTGHTYDEGGNILEYGEELRSTAFGKNLILNQGFDVWFGEGSGEIYRMICGPSNVPPDPGDTVMGDAFGYASLYAGSTEVASNNDPGLGALYRTISHRRTFVPGALGASPVNVSKAGIARFSILTPNLSQVRAAPLLSAGLLVDSLGAPTSISVNPDEYLDIVWELTIFVPYEVSGTVSIDVEGVPTNFDYVVRPQALWRVSGNPGRWASLSTDASQVFPAFWRISTIFNDGTYRPSGVANGALVPPATATAMFSSGFIFTSVSAASYVLGSKERSFTAVLAPLQGNPSPDITRMVLSVGESGAGAYFQLLFDPGLPKTSSNQLSITFTLSMDNV